MPARTTPARPETPVGALWNLSEKTAGWLTEEGIETFADLCEADLIGVWISLKAKHRQVTRLMYYALWGARHDCHWRSITEADKARFEAALAQR